MPKKTLQYIDFEKVNTLLEGFFQSTGIVSTILDLEGKALSKSGGQQLCAACDQLRSDGANKCHQGVLAWTAKSGIDEKYRFYQCKNGLMEVAVPILILGEHVANLLSGCFFMEKPDLVYYEQQAVTWGFDKTAFLNDILNVPVLSEEKVKSVVTFLLNMIQLTLDMTHQQGETAQVNKSLISKRREEEIIEIQTQQLPKPQNVDYLLLNKKLKQLNAELQSAKEKTEESENRIHAMFSTSNAGIAVIDVKGNILEWNDTFLKYFGYEPEEIKAHNIRDLTFPDDLEETLHQHSLIVTHQVPNFRIEKRFCRKDNSVFWVDISGSALRKNGEVYAIMGLMYDITERKIIEQQLQSQFTELITAKEKAVESEINLQTILSSTNDIIASYDLNIRLLTFNKACSETYKSLFNIEIYPGLCTLDLFPESMRAFWNYHNSRAIAGETFSVEINVPTENGELIFEQYYNPIFKDGKVVCFSTFTRDITEKKRIENELIASKEKAEESDRLKTAFLQNMSHEIRTPMNAIMGFSDLLLKYADNKTKLISFTEIISQRCNDLLDIINDILDISKIESGQIPVYIEETNLNELFEELFLFFSEYLKRINKQHIKLVINPLCNPDGNLILTDKVKLKQIFINLISNAIKFTDDGTIECSCKIDEYGNIIFYVADTGTGIPKDKQQQVFERFFQLHQSNKKNIGGTGLGLSIVKALVDLLGGQVFLLSEPGKGSTFSFTMPYKLAPVIARRKEVGEKINKGNFKGKTILIIEDDDYNAEYIKEIISDLSLNVLLADNGLGAVEMALSHSIDIVLMDIRLPDINGYEVIHQILMFKPQLKIIAQTAYASYDEKQKALDAGCIDYISKPIKEELLLSLLHKHLRV